MIEKGLAPICAPTSTILILGSMPSVTSLREQQYYGHPRNAFWKIMATVTGIPFDAPYNKRVEALKAHNIALWDVIDQCERPGSLDSAIVTSSIETNALADFIQQHNEIRTIGLNGGKAWALFQKVMKPHQSILTHIKVVKLPSTSPAYTLPFEEKLAQWQEVLIH